LVEIRLEVIMEAQEIICPKCKGAATAEKSVGTGGCSFCWGEGVIRVIDGKPVSMEELLEKTDKGEWR
jgi:hypothetical protein